MPGGSLPGERRGGRKKGTPNQRTTFRVRHRHALVSKAIKGGQIMPLDVMLAHMRAAWNKGDFATAHAAARDCAPYIHPRLHSVEAKTETTIIVATAEERRERARQAILEAFAERPMLTVSPIIEHEPVELNDEELKSDDS